MGNNNFIALDIGGVCLNLTPERTLAALGYSELQEIPEEFIEAVRKWECGFIDDREWLDIFQNISGRRFSDSELIEIWNLILGPDMKGMPEFVKKITELGYRFIFFSDIAAVHLKQVYRQLSFAHLVTGGVFSYKVGAQKPGDEMYDTFEKLYGKPALYIDDKNENIENGREHGWESHLFISTEKLRDYFYFLHENR